MKASSNVDQLQVFETYVISVMTPKDACQSLALSSSIKQRIWSRSPCAGPTSRDNLSEANMTRKG